MGEPECGFSCLDRLRKRREYLRVYEQGTRFQAPHLVLFFQANELGRSRLGLTVSRKIGRSVVRNRIKRRLREIFRTNRACICPSSDVVVNAKRSAATASFQELRDSFLWAARRWSGTNGP